MSNIDTFVEGETYKLVDREGFLSFLEDTNQRILNALEKISPDLVFTVESVDSCRDVMRISVPGMSKADATKHMRTVGDCYTIFTHAERHNFVTVTAEDTAKEVLTTEGGIDKLLAFSFDKEITLKTEGGSREFVGLAPLLEHLNKEMRVQELVAEVNELQSKLDEKRNELAVLQMTM